MVSVLLPTREWVPACGQLAEQLADGDELLVVCDAETDPIALRDTPDGVDVLVAGDPEGCSGKANALAWGMECAACDRFVWTDGDFDHCDGWLDDVKAESERHGVVTGVPFFVGDGWWRLAEPVCAVTGSLGIYLGDVVWGGCVAFTREDVDVDALVADLRRTVSDDGLLSARVDRVTAVESLSEVIHVNGDYGAVRERVVRFVKTVRFVEAIDASVVGAGVLLSVVLTLLWTLPALVATTALVGATYWFFGVRRWTFLLAAPAFLLAPAVFAYALAADDFEWGGRRYRWEGVYDVTVLK